MKIGLVGSSYQQRSLPFDAQRTINLIPLKDKQGADVSSLLGTPGLTLRDVCGPGPVRGVFSAANGRAFVVSGATFYSIPSKDTSTVVFNYGLLNTSSGAVTFADNGVQLGICDGTYAYTFTYATDTLAQITDVDFPASVGGIDFIDGYFVVNENDTGKFFISALYDGTSWDALDFATAESSPDKLVRAVNFVGQLGLFGENTLEIWRNTGDSLFPFSRISGSTPIGTLSPDTIVSLDTSVYWVGNNKEGSGIVYKAQGFTPVRISTEPIEKILQADPNPELLRAWTYQQGGHAFLVITGSSLSTSVVYDISTEEWHERAFLNPDGFYEQHLGSCCMQAFGKQIVGDRRNGNVYIMSLDTYSDNGAAIKRARIYTHLLDELKPIKYSRLTIGVETGVGLQTGQGSDPKIALRVSRDGARTWSDYFTKPIGAVGKYLTEVTFRRLGIQQICTFEVSISDPVKVAITGSYLS